MDRTKVELAAVPKLRGEAPKLNSATMLQPKPINTYHIYQHIFFFTGKNESMLNLPQQNTDLVRLASCVLTTETSSKLNVRLKTLRLKQSLYGNLCLCFCMESYHPTQPTWSTSILLWKLRADAACRVPRQPRDIHSNGLSETRLGLGLSLRIPIQRL